MKHYFWGIVLLGLLFSNCKKDENPATTPFQEPTTKVSDLSGDLAKEWMNLTYNLVKSNGLRPPMASRFYAYTAITIHESLVNGIDNGVSIAGQVNGLSSLPKPEPGKRLDYGLVMAASMREIIPPFLPAISSIDKNKVENLYSQQYFDRVRLGKISQPTAENSIAYGKKLAQEIIKWCEQDKFITTRSLTYTPPPRTTNKLFWDPSTLNQKPLEPFWGTLRTFALTDGAQCDPGIDFSYDPIAGNKLHDEMKAVWETSKTLTAEQKAIATYWSNDPVITGTPPGHWVGIIGQIIEQKGMSLDKAAQTYALMTMGVADAFISCWYVKYKYNTLRPITYIRENFEPGWTSFINTPSFPDYTSGHSTSSGAAAEILTKLLGDNIAFVDNTNSERGLPPRSYTSFIQAAEESAVSRFYGGIHHETSNVAGLSQGKCIGANLITKIKLTK
jgi:hypothetical protein